MTKKHSLTSAFIIACATVIALMVAFVTPVSAHHRDGHEGGRQDNSSNGSETTEDNDDDGHPNSPDPEGDSDNKHPSGKDKHDEPGGSGNQGSAQSDPDDDGRGPDRSNGGADQPGGSGGEDKLDQDGNNGCGNDDDFEDDNEGLCLGRRGGEIEARRAIADVTIEADCFSVTVTSSKDISFVEVTFADGSTVKFEGLHDTFFEMEFDQQVVSARAKSATTTVSATVEEVCVLVEELVEEDEVLGEIIFRPPPLAQIREQPALPEEEEVLGVRVSREAAPEVAGAEAQAQREEEGVLPVTGSGIAGIALLGLALMTAGGALVRSRRT